MKVIMDRNTCGHHPAACEQCFGEFLRHGVADRGCVLEAIEDGKPEIDVEIRSGGHSAKLLVTEANREEVIYDGWMKFVEMPQEAFEILPPHGADLRRIQLEQEKE